MEQNVFIMNHPLIHHKLSILRDEKTSSRDFRTLVSEIAMLMCYEATRDLALQEVEVQTPVAVAKVKKLAGRKLAVVPILRAGLGMVDGMVNLVPSARVGHIGLYRDPETLMPAKYFTSVSVFTEDSGLADALSTALFCMPYEDGLALVSGIGGVEVVWVDMQYRVLMTDGIVVT